MIGLKGHQGVCAGGIAGRDDCRLVAVCDDNPEALDGVAGWPASDDETRTFTDLETMFAETDLDIVCEAGTDNLRGGIIMKCAERGIHVITEKPLAFTLDELAQVREAVDAMNITLSMLLTMRYDPIYVAMKQVVDGGALGQVCLATMQKSYRLGNRPEWQRSRETFSGIIPFIGIHALDLIYYTSGEYFVSGSAFAANTGHPELRDMEDNACMALQLSGGGSAAVRLDYCRPAAAPTHGDDRLRLAGVDAVLEAMHCGEVMTFIDKEAGQSEVAPADDVVNQWDDFIGYVEGGECIAPAQDCFYMTEVVLRLREAAATGTLAQLPSP
jgi:predicted dehydrogenase